MQHVLPSINKPKLRGSWTRPSGPDPSATARLTFSRHRCGRSKRVTKRNIQKIQISGGGNEVWIGLQNGWFCQQSCGVGLTVRRIQSSGELVTVGLNLGSCTGISPRRKTKWKKPHSRAPTANWGEVCYATTEFSCTFRLLSSQATSEFYGVWETAAVPPKYRSADGKTHKQTPNRRQFVGRNEHLTYPQTCAGIFSPEMTSSTLAAP